MIHLQMYCLYSWFIYRFKVFTYDSLADVKFLSHDSPVDVNFLSYELPPDANFALNLSVDIKFLSDESSADE